MSAPLITSPRLQYLLIAILLALTLLASFVAEASRLEHRLLDDDAYPVALAAMTDGKLVEVVGADARRQMMTGMQGERVDASEANVVLAKGVAFADGVLRVAASQVAVIEPEKRPALVASSFRGRGAGGTLIEATLEPERDYKDVVMVVVFFAPDGRYEISAQSIGDLTAGQRHNASARTPVAYDYRNYQINYTFLFFNNEGEIVTDLRSQATPLVNRIFRDFYRNLIESYQAANVDQSVPARLVHRYPIDFEDLKGRYFGGQNSAVFTLGIDDAGMVESVETTSEITPELLARCERSMKQWLFLPELKDGFPVSSLARVPVSW